MKLFNQPTLPVFLFLFMMVFINYACQNSATSSGMNNAYLYSKSKPSFLEARIFDGFEDTYKVCFEMFSYYEDISAVTLKIEGTNVLTKNINLDSIHEVLKPYRHTVHCFNLNQELINKVSENKHFLFFSSPLFSVNIRFTNDYEIEAAFKIQHFDNEHEHENYYYIWEEADIGKKLGVNGVLLDAVWKGDYAVCGKPHTSKLRDYVKVYKEESDKTFLGLKVNKETVHVSAREIETKEGKLCYLLHSLVIDRKIVEKRMLYIDENKQKQERSMGVFTEIISLYDKGHIGLSHSNTSYCIAYAECGKQRKTLPEEAVQLLMNDKSGQIVDSFFFPNNPYHQIVKEQ